GLFQFAAKCHPRCKSCLLLFRICVVSLFVMLILVFLGSFVRTTLALSSEATCYFPDKSVATGNYPCFLDQSDSPCCGAGSTCEASGLCKMPGSTGVSKLIRGACTDSTWTSSS